MNNLIDVIVKYNNLTKEEKELFKNVIDSNFKSIEKNNNSVDAIKRNFDDMVKKIKKEEQNPPYIRPYMYPPLLKDNPYLTRGQPFIWQTASLGGSDV